MDASNPASPRWRKSRYSNNGGECVEVADLDTGAVGVRDSKSPNLGHLTFQANTWATFTANVKAGQYNRR